MGKTIKRIAISVMAMTPLIGTFAFSGCFHNYDPEKDKHATIIRTDFFKVQLFEVTQFARIYGLTELGKQQEILAVPTYIDGYPVKQIGVLGYRKYGIESDNLRKIYIPQTIYSRMYNGMPIASGSIVCKDQVVYLSDEYANWNNGGEKIIVTPEAKEDFIRNKSKEYLESIEKFLESVLLVNICYYSNYESAEFVCHWADYITGTDDLYLEPEKPKREDYIFTGWFFEPECLTEWDGLLPTSESEKLSLYAGWNLI